MHLIIYSILIYHNIKSSLCSNFIDLIFKNFQLVLRECGLKNPLIPALNSTKREYLRSKR